MDCFKQNRIVGIGACVMDTLVTVPNFPKEDTKLQAISSKVVGGGPTATGLVAAQKLGEQTAYIGVLADDNGGVFLNSDFDETYRVQQDDLVEFPYGYHATVGTPGYTTYLLWLMAGDYQGFNRSNDPKHTWMAV